MIKGNNGEDHEKGGTPVPHRTCRKCSSPALLPPPGVFQGLAGQDGSLGRTVRRLKVEMYCEDIASDFGSATTAVAFVAEPGWSRPPSLIASWSLSAGRPG